MWPFNKAKQTDPLKMVDDIYREVENKFNQRLTTLQSAERSLRSELDTLQKKHGELVMKLREQTDADILLLITRMKRDILAEKKVPEPDISYLNNLRAQQQMLASQNTYGYGFGGGLLNALGHAGRSAL